MEQTPDQKKTSKRMVLMAYFMLGFYALSRVLDLFLLDKLEIGAPGTPPYSIFSSAKIFIAYQVWGIIMCGFAAYAIWKRQRLLIYVAMTVLIILFFYPWFTSQ